MAKLANCWQKLCECIVAFLRTGTSSNICSHNHASDNGRFWTECEQFHKHRATNQTPGPYGPSGVAVAVNGSCSAQRRQPAAGQKNDQWYQSTLAAQALNDKVSRWQIHSNAHFPKYRLWPVSLYSNAYVAQIRASCSVPSVAVNFLSVCSWLKCTAFRRTNNGDQCGRTVSHSLRFSFI